MRVIVLAVGTALTLLHQPTIAESAAKPQISSAKLEGMEYLEARKVILSFGWVPARAACSGPDVNDQTCTKYPELDNCTGVGIGLCGMNFVRRNRCLILVTIGGAPQEQPGDTVIRDVAFRRGSCPLAFVGEKGQVASLTGVLGHRSVSITIGGDPSLGAATQADCELRAVENRGSWHLIPFTSDTVAVHAKDVRDIRFSLELMDDRAFRIETDFGEKVCAAGLSFGGTYWRH
jgi:hypothetical protein